MLQIAKIDLNYESQIRVSEAVTRSCSVKKMFFKILQKSLENTCVRGSFLVKLQTSSNFTKKEILVQVFSYKFCEIFKNIFLWNTSGGSFLNTFSFGLSSVTSKVFVADSKHVFVCWKGMNNHWCSSNPRNTLPRK